MDNIDHVTLRYVMRESGLCHHEETGAFWGVTLRGSGVWVASNVGVIVGVNVAEGVNVGVILGGGGDVLLGVGVGFNGSIKSSRI